jgi:hypothetical protein
LRCCNNAVRHSKLCKVHGGMNHLASKLAQESPQVRKRSVICRSRARQYDCHSAFILDDLNVYAQSEHKKVNSTDLYPSLSARGRKLQAIAKRVDWQHDD